MSAQSGGIGLLRFWHWFAVLGILLLSLIPKAGLWIAGTCALLGAVLAVIGGVAPFLRILCADPGTVALMLTSRSARFEMMNQPDSHPYKKLVRGAFGPTRGLFWRGVLLVITFIPAAFLNTWAGQFAQRQQAGGPPPAGPRAVVDGVQLPNRGMPGPPGMAEPGPRGPGAMGPGGGRPPFPPQGQAGGPMMRVTVTYADSSIEGDVKAAVTKALADVVGVQIGTIEVNVASREIVFDMQGPQSMPFVGRGLSRAGFQQVQMSMRNK